MERDKNFSDRTPSRGQERVPQAGGHERQPEERRPAAEVDNDTNEGMKDASGKLPRGDV